jgi:heme exporter protein D
MDLGPHAFFILAAYGATALIVLGLILRAFLDYRAQLRALAELEGRGARRRSSGETFPDGAVSSLT